MRPKFDRRLWISLIIIFSQCVNTTNQQNVTLTKTLEAQSVLAQPRKEQQATPKDYIARATALGDRKETSTTGGNQLEAFVSTLQGLDKCANCLQKATQPSLYPPNQLVSSFSSASTFPSSQGQLLAHFKPLKMPTLSPWSSSWDPAKSKAISSASVFSQKRNKKETFDVQKQKLLLHAYLNGDTDMGNGGLQTSLERKPERLDATSDNGRQKRSSYVRTSRYSRGIRTQQSTQKLLAERLLNSDQRGGDQSLSNSAGLSSSEEELIFQKSKKMHQLSSSSSASTSALVFEISPSDIVRTQTHQVNSDIRINKNNMKSSSSMPTKATRSSDGNTSIVMEMTDKPLSSSSAPSLSSSFSSSSTSAAYSSLNFSSTQSLANAAAELASSLPNSLLYSSQFSSLESGSSSLEDLSSILPSKLPQSVLVSKKSTRSSDTPSRSLFRASINSRNGHHLSKRIEVRDELPTSSLLKSKSTRSAVLKKPLLKPKEPVIIIDDAEEFDSGAGNDLGAIADATDDKSEDYSHDEPRVLSLRPIIREPYDDDEEMSVVYSEQHTEIRLMCEVDLDIATSTWYKNGQIVHAIDRTSRVTDYRFIKEPNGGLTINNVMLEDDGKWQCEAENTRAYVENARPVKLVVLDRPKPPYLLIDSRRLDAGNIFVPVKENSELNLACISEGGNPKPTLTWEVLLSPGVDRHAQKVAAEVLELEEIKNDKDKLPYTNNSGAKSEARLSAVYRAHHNARILCVMEHPTLKIRQNASLLLDVQYTPSFAISRTPGFGYPLREAIEVSLKCDVDSNPPSTPRWQKDDGDTPVPQIGDGFLNFTSIRREHSGWYKCTSRHLNFQYSSIGYYLSVRYDSVDVTSEPDDQDVSVAASHNPNKGQLEVQLGGAVTLQCPQGSLGCWSHLDPVTARLRGLGHGLSSPSGQFSLKDVVYQDAGTYKCIGQSPTNKKKLEVLQTVGVQVKGAPTVVARNATPVAYPGSPLHLTVEFCANPAAHAARWLHGDRVFTPGNQYGSTVLAYGVTDLPTPYCKEARLTYVSMHERVPRTFYFIVSSPGGVAEAVFKVNFTMRYRAMSNSVDDEEEELSEPEEIHFPVFGSGTSRGHVIARFETTQLLPTTLLLTVVLFPH